MRGNNAQKQGLVAHVQPSVLFRDDLVPLDVSISSFTEVKIMGFSAVPLAINFAPLAITSIETLGASCAFALSSNYKLQK